jgi:mRNA-degrading endonuclease RelE of RelBE toxin-antitoxin system
VDFRIADTFTDSLARLTGDEQKAVKTTAFDLQVNPAAPGMQFHKLEKAKDKNFWSVRVSSDIRLIVHRTQGSLLLCYADHHDAAYGWAERRRLETHPKTGAAQWVEIRERVQEVVLPRYVEAPAAKRALFADTTTDDLFACGVPAEWLEDVRRATEDGLLDLADHLPAEAAEALLVLATGGTLPRLADAATDEARARQEFAAEDARVEREVVPEAEAVDLHAPDSDAFEHPEARRRFRTVSSVEELERALEYPWDRWTVFLHPAQRESVERRYGGPARVAGSAGTGKTIVALHRAVHLARTNPDARVLLTTFSELLANALRTRLRRLIGNEPHIGERLEVHALDGIARRLYELNLERPKVASVETVRGLLRAAAQEAGAQRFSAHFLEAEWRDVVDAWQLTTWEAYRDVARLGRKTRLPEAQRRSLWDVFERVRLALGQQGLLTPSDMLASLTSHLLTVAQRPFQFVIVDEAQDLSVAQLRFLAALAGGTRDSLFFAETWGSASSSSRSPGRRWESTCAAVRGRCA